MKKRKKSRKWPLPAALCWQQVLRLPPPQPEEAINEFIKRVARVAVETHTLGELSEMFKSEEGLLVSKENLSMYFRELGILSTFQMTDARKANLRQMHNVLQSENAESRVRSIEMFKEGKSLGQIAKELENRPATVSLWLKAAMQADPSLRKATCVGCDKQIERTTVGQKYCERSCYMRNYHRERHGFKTKVGQLYPCAVCGAEFKKNSGSHIHCKACGSEKAVRKRYYDRLKG